MFLVIYRLERKVYQISILQDIMSGFDFEPLLILLLSLIPSLFSITVHECCHGLTALYFGDDTAKRSGRLSLNPLRHADWFGLAMMAVFHVGWAKPVPVNMYRMKNPKRDMALTALAGPVSNFLLAFVFMFLYGALYIPFSKNAVGRYFLQMLTVGGQINIGLAVFNFIPIPPLDGSKILFSLISDEAYAKLMHYEKYGFLVLIVLVSTGILGSPLNRMISFLLTQIYLPTAQWACRLVLHIFY